jgi:GntR family transcriptional regulator, rspAB operon transcriptional repressor
MTAMGIDLSQHRLDRSRPLRDQIYPMVRGLILTGAIKPGEVIDEKAIAPCNSTCHAPPCGKP